MSIKIEGEVKEIRKIHYKIYRNTVTNKVFYKWNFFILLKLSIIIITWIILTIYTFYNNQQ